MRIQDKTELRRMLTNAVGTTGQYDYLAIYAGGAWDMINGDNSTDAVVAVEIGQLLHPRNEYANPPKTIHSLITRQFVRLEKLANEIIADPNCKSYYCHQAGL